MSSSSTLTTASTSGGPREGLNTPRRLRPLSPLATSLGPPGDMSPIVACAALEPHTCEVQGTLPGPRLPVADVRKIVQRWMEAVQHAEREAAAAAAAAAAEAAEGATTAAPAAEPGNESQAEPPQPGLRGPWTTVRASYKTAINECMSATDYEANTLLRKALWQSLIVDLRAASGMPRRMLFRDPEVLYGTIALFRWTYVRTMRNEHAPFKQATLPAIVALIAQDLAALEAAERAAQQATPPVASPTAPPAAPPAVSGDAEVNDPVKRHATTARHERSVLDPQVEDSGSLDGRDVQSYNNIEPTQRSHAPSGGESAELALASDDDPYDNDPPYDNNDEARAY